MRHFVRRSSSLILASLAMAATDTSAVAHTLSLDCVGERTPISVGGTPRAPDSSYDRSYHHIFYVDLAAQKYCEDTCQIAQRLVKANSDIIDMSWVPPKDQFINVSGGDRKFFRKTGKFVTDETYSYGSWSRFKMQGRCTVAPLKSVTIKEFLAHAPN